MKTQGAFSFIVISLSLLMAGVLTFQTEARTEEDHTKGTLIYHASSSGHSTLDSDAQGGNPFASAFIEQISQPGITLKQFNRGMVELTNKYSEGFQNADIPKSIKKPNWIITPGTKGGKRIALVIVLSDYSAAKEIQSLPGAKFDANRVAKALKKAGYNTRVALDLKRIDFLKELSNFKERSRKADAAIIYTTGHGGEFNEKVYLIAGDYPIKKGRDALETHAYAVSEIAEAAYAKNMNMIFYAGCRNEPF